MFKHDTSSYRRYAAADLHRFTCQTLERCGMSADHARAVADCLIRADLMGVDSHGIAHLDEVTYVKGFETGRCDPKGQPQVVKDTAVAAVVDGNNCLGPVGDALAMQICMEKARKTGMAGVAVRNCGHAGMSGHWCLMAAENDFIGFAFTNTGRGVAPAGGYQPMLGTNPTGIAAPALNDHPFLYEAATSTVAAGKLEIARRAGLSVPLGWVLDAEGNDTTDPNALWNGGALLPLGSFAETSAHKGYGLAVMVEVLCALLAGGTTTWRSPTEKILWSQFFLCIDPAQFQPLEDFKRGVDQMMADLRAAPPRPGVAAVLAPGDKEYRALAERSARGVPLHPKVVASLDELADRLGVARIRPL